MTCRYCLLRPAQQKGDSGMCPACWHYLEGVKRDSPEYFAQVRRIANLRHAQRGGLS